MENKTNKLLEFQKKIGIISKDARNPHFKNTYASLTQILSEVKPILSELGLTILQPIDNGKVTTIIMNGDLVIASSSIDLPTNLQPQPMGSAITYFRRYTLSSLLALEIADDDGESAKQTPIVAKKPILEPKQFEAMIEAINNGKGKQVEDSLGKYEITPQQLTAIKTALKHG